MSGNPGGAAQRLEDAVASRVLCGVVSQKQDSTCPQLSGAVHSEVSYTPITKVEVEFQRFLSCLASGSLAIRSKGSAPKGTGPLFHIESIKVVLDQIRESYGALHS